MRKFFSKTVPSRRTESWYRNKTSFLISTMWWLCDLSWKWWVKWLADSMVSQVALYLLYAFTVAWTVWLCRPTAWTCYTADTAHAGLARTNGAWRTRRWLEKNWKKTSYRNGLFSLISLCCVPFQTQSSTY